MSPFAALSPTEAAISLTPTRRFATLAATACVLLPVYGAIGVYTAGSGGKRHTLPSALDDMVPFEPAWVVVYALVFLQALAPLAVVTDPRVLNRTVAAYLTIYAIGTPIWLLYPVVVPRPPLPIVDLWTYGIGIVRYVDPPGNCMPSMHVALAVMATLAVRRHDRLAGALLAVSAALIWWSTLAIRQHWASDGVVGAGFAIVADQLWFAMKPLPPEAFVPLHRAWHLTWILTFVVAVLVLMSGWWFGWVPIEALPPNAVAW